MFLHEDHVLGRTEESIFFGKNDETVENIDQLFIYVPKRSSI